VISKNFLAFKYKFNLSTYESYPQEINKTFRTKMIALQAVKKAPE